MALCCATVSAPAPVHVEVYLFRRRGAQARFLILRRAPGEAYPGIWQPVTGRIRRGERPLAAAVREVREETGLEPRRWWALESPSIYCDPATGRLRVLPLFAAQVDPAARVRLSCEHDAYRFTPLARAAGRFLWDAQRHACEQIRRQVLRGGPLSRALDITDSMPRARPPGRARRRST